MCGIVGKITFDGSRVDKGLVRAMANSLAHRGPDADGIHIEPNVGLGFRRLAIIDLSPSANQPMANEDGTVWIVFNGEIYNFHELRPILERKGHVFRSNSDTETILHLYEEYGERCVRYLRGMFAFAIWDSKRQRLFAARDRLGKKPFKYYMDGKTFVFASELKALLKDPEVPRIIDEEAVHHYLTLQYVPQPLTGYKGIQKLPAAHSMVVEKGKVRIERYWQLDFTKKQQLSKEEWKERILAKLEESVRLRLISDVPLGAFLSGGLDSSTVVAMMARHTKGKVKTFSIGFEQESHNELPLARCIAERFDTEHTEFVVQPNALELLPKLVAQYDEPFADSSSLPTFLVSQLTRKHVTVALNGDGGDENFAGYPWHLVQLAAETFRRLPNFVLSPVEAMMRSLRYDHRSTTNRRFLIFLRSLRMSQAERYSHYFTTSYFAEWEKRAMYTHEFSERTSAFDTPTFYAKHTSVKAELPLDTALAYDVDSYLPDDLLVKVDIASMANSLEARSPFLDQEFMELAAAMPPEMKIQKRQTKAFFRWAVSDLLPQEIIQAPKRGFMVPLDAWFRTDLKRTVQDRLLTPGALLRAYIRPDAIQGLYDEHQGGKMNHGSRLWSLLALEEWLHLAGKNR